MNVLYEDNHLLVIEKPVNVPSQADDSCDVDCLSLCKQYLKEKYNKPGNVYCGLVHRLDRPVGGVMVFAKTSKAASRLSEQVRTHTFHKRYEAVVCSTELPKQATLTDWLLKDSKLNRSKVVKATTPNAKKAILHFECLAQKDGYSFVSIQLETGRSHQIRVQFSSRKWPLWGDQRYNPIAKNGQQIALWAKEVTLVHPTTKETMTFTCPLPKYAPWNLF